MTGLTPAQKSAKRANSARQKWRVGLARRSRMTPGEVEAEEVALRLEIEARIDAGDIIVGPPAGWKFIQDAAA